MKKKTFIIRLFLLIGLLLLTLASTSFADRVLSFPQRFQEHSQWCWAGSSEAVLNYYGHGPSQCDEANFALERSNCCGNSTFEWDHACNVANSMFGSGGLQGILTNWGVNSNAVYSSLPQNTARSEIDAKRPFVMRFGWAGGGGHFLDGYGMVGDYLYYMDPWPGHGYTISLYNWVVYAASDHTWTHTLQLTTNPHGRAEIIGTWNGIWYRNLANSTWTQTFSYVPDGPIAVGDVNGDGKADMVSSWNSGLWWQNGATWGWNKVYTLSPLKLAAADITGDGKAEIIGAGGWNGIWYWNPATNGWTQMFASNPNGGIAAGDINGDGHADVASAWTSGLWWQNGANLGWNKVYTLSPLKLAAADITGDGKAEIIGAGGWNGIWYWNPATNGWTQMFASNPNGGIAAGDVTGDGKADVVSCWASGLWFQKGTNLEWKKVYDIAPSKLAVGNITGD